MSDGDAGGYRFTRGPDGWTLAEGAGLPVPLRVIFSRAPDGRQVLTGLQVGDGAPGVPVTSAVLRRIRLSEIQAAFFGERGESAGRGGALREFAAAYLAEMARQPHRAMTAAAEALGISRATANRRAALCRKLGYLPA